MIGNEIVVEVLSISGDGVRLGISAPRTTSVHRHEVFVEIEAANRAAGAVDDAADLEALENLSAQIKGKQ